MATIPLFASWTWKVRLPAPFDRLPDSMSKTAVSAYNKNVPSKFTLHSAFLSAVLAYMEMDTTLMPESASECAIGTQDEKTVAEYKSRTKETHVVVFNKKTGKFNVGRFDDPSSTPRVYTLKESGNSGTALFFALMPEALTDAEFKENYDILGKCKNDGYADEDTYANAAFILCDNIYRRDTVKLPVHGQPPEPHCPESPEGSLLPEERPLRQLPDPEVAFRACIGGCHRQE